jgi:hypothetical protein
MLILKTSPIVDNQTSVTPSFDRAHITTNADPSLLKPPIFRRTTT